MFVVGFFTDRIGRSGLTQQWRIFPKRSLSGKDHARAGPPEIYGVWAYTPSRRFMTEDADDQVGLTQPFIGFPGEKRKFLGALFPSP